MRIKLLFGKKLVKYTLYWDLTIIKYMKKNKLLVCEKRHNLADDYERLII